MTQPLDSAVDRSRTAMEVASEGVELQSRLHNHNFNLLNDFTVSSNPRIIVSHQPKNQISTCRNLLE